MTNRKFIAASLLAIVAATGAHAEVNLGLAAIDLQNSFYVRMKEGGDAAAKDYGVNASWQSAEGSLERQVAIIENFINQKVDVILVDPLDKNALVPVIRRATEAGIPVISMGNLVEAGENYSTLYPDYENMSFVAKALGAAVGEDGKLGLLVGTRGNFVSDVRESGFADTIAKLYPDIQIVGIEPTSWDNARATNAVQTWLATYPDLDGIACITDSLCLAASAVTAAMGADVKFGGYDGDLEMHPMLESGQMVADVLTGAYRVGYWNIAVAARLAEGEELPKQLYMPTYFVMSDETAADLAAKGVEAEYLTPAEAELAATDATAQLGPDQPAEAMSVAPPAQQVTTSGDEG